MLRPVLRLSRCLCLLVAALACGPAGAQAADRRFTTSDGVSLHVIEQGSRAAPTIVFVPGWTMPAWIFGPQLAALAPRYHVVAFDPRGQGDSDIPATGYDHLRRGQDIAELIATLGGRPVLLVGWSLGVLDSLAYVHQHGDRLLAGLVLIDNSVGENPPPAPGRAAPPGPRLPRDQQMRRFVRGMFARSPGEAYLDALTEAALRTPPAAAARLARYPVPRTYWREAVHAVEKPVLYVVRPRFAAQAETLSASMPGVETAVFAHAGHALFIDEQARFDSLLDGFIRRRVWP